jgi:hypothetical protein
MRQPGTGANWWDSMARNQYCDETFGKAEAFLASLVYLQLPWARVP